jgi:acyl carrier protein
MYEQDRLQFIEAMLELPPDTLTGGEWLRDLEAWDSLSTMLFIATVDKKFGVPLPGHRVSRCQTIGDLGALLDEAAAAHAA